MPDLHPLGSPERPIRAAVIGSGPSAFYAAEALLKQDHHIVELDMFDRLPTPYGLVRGGVAPDHQKIKSVIAVYEKVAALAAFRFFGNVRIGKDIPVSELRRFYDCVIYAVGNESDRKLGIPGEDLEGSFAATEFVGWYNGHPNHSRKSFNLQVKKAAVVGVGNVAMDVTRILAKDPELLAKTDMPDYAVETLRASHIREIYILGRRGVVQASFSPAEIMEIAEVETADLVIDPADAEPDEFSKQQPLSTNAQKNVGFLQEQAGKGEGCRPKKVRLRFLVSPVEIIGENGKVTGVKIEKNTLRQDENGRVRPQGTGQYELLPVGLVLRSVGYRGIPIPEVPFDEKKGIIPNLEGRVIAPNTQQPLAGEYVVGWMKRGPTGLIGSNRADSVATAQSLWADIQERKAPATAEKKREALIQYLTQEKIRWISFADWKRIDQTEIADGKRKGKIREKFTEVSQMLAALKEGPVAQSVRAARS